MKIIEYDNLEASVEDFTVWKTDASFDTKASSKEELYKLQDFRLTEIIVGDENVHPDKVNHDALMRQYYSLVDYMIFEWEKSLSGYFVFFEHKSKPKSRIRSYKGLVDKKNYC